MGSRRRVEALLKGRAWRGRAEKLRGSEEKASGLWLGRRKENVKGREVSVVQNVLLNVGNMGHGMNRSLHLACALEK